LVAVVVWAGALGCIDAHPDPRILTGPLLVDSEFDGAQREAIAAAVELWSDATNGRFVPQLSFGSVRCEQAFAIKAVHSEGCHIGQAAGDDGAEGTERVLGAADRDSHWVSVVTWLEGDEFRNNVAHELGHYLLIGHGDGIMAQARDQQSTEIAPATVSEFCAIWDCNIVRGGSPRAVRRCTTRVMSRAAVAASSTVMENRVPSRSSSRRALPERTTTAARPARFWLPR
jgi:hypothetical protein